MTNDDRREDLLHARLDSVLSDMERDELEHLLADDARARQRAAELDALSEALGSLGPVEPPADLLRSVLDQIGHSAPASGAVGRIASMAAPRAVGAPPTIVHDKPSISHGGVMRRKVLIGLAAAAAVVLAVMSYLGFPPDQGGTEGAIGAARRYQAGQIAAEDVKLGDQAAQQFLQSDVFNRILRDDATRKLFSDPNFRALLGNGQMRVLLGGQELKGLLDSNALADGSVRSLVADANLASAVASRELNAAFANENFLKALSDLEFREALAKGEFKALSDNSALRANLANDAAFRANLQKMERIALFRSDAFLRALSSKEFRLAALNENAIRLFDNANFVTALNNADFRSLISDANLRGLLGLRGLSAALADQGLARMVADGSLHQALQGGALQQALSSPGLAAALQSPQFGEALRAVTRNQP